MGSALLAVDIGTSATKVVAFDTAGVMLARRRGETTTNRFGDGLAEHDMDALWATVAGLVREIVAALPDHTVESVGIASVGEGGVPVDGAGRPVRPAFAWFDRRGDVEARWWERELGHDRVYRISGQPIDAQYGVMRMMWLREHEPAAFAATRHWLALSDFVILRLSGVIATDQSMASRTMLFDQRRRAWSTDLLRLAGLDASLMPQAVPSGTRVGSVTREAAAATGLREGTPVVTGGHDRLCACFASRGSDPVVVDSTGSAEAVVVPIAEYVERDPAENGFAACYADVVPGRYVISARVGYAGALVDWLRRFDPQGGHADHLTIDAEVGWPLRPTGLLVYPSFGRVVAPDWDPATMPGMMVGMTLGTTPANIAQALVEGVGYSLRANLDNLERRMGSPGQAVRVEGSLTASRTWMQLKADVAGRPMEGIHLDEATALGAALLGGVGAGLFRDHAEAGAAVVRDLVRWEPDPARTAVYARMFEEGYRKLPGMIARLAPALDGSRDG
jgi:xylulokinase